MPFASFPEIADTIAFVGLGVGAIGENIARIFDPRADVGPCNVPLYNFQQCHDALVGVKVASSIPEAGVAQFDNVPAPCMDLSTVLVGGCTGADPRPTPCGSACIKYTGLTDDQLANSPGRVVQLREGFSLARIPKTFHEAVKESIENLRRKAQRIKVLYSGMAIIIEAEHAKSTLKDYLSTERQHHKAACCRKQLGEGSGYIPRKDEDCLVDMRLTLHDIDSSDQARRAWPVQKRVVSRRLLAFAVSQMYYQRREPDSCETFPPSQLDTGDWRSYGAKETPRKKGPAHCPRRGSRDDVGDAAGSLPCRALCPMVLAADPPLDGVSQGGEARDRAPASCQLSTWSRLSLLAVTVRAASLGLIKATGTILLQIDNGENASLLSATAAQHIGNFSEPFGALRVGANDLPLAPALDDLKDIIILG
ncbi:hypothetical protein PG993_005018 [Apiospora rasikravindrae]|uniref:Uncharacterized protein n=1 Tax=Apiospora rasikravindrae TaxID=990691 RepID=A0ABR1TEE7_9PEZI